MSADLLEPSPPPPDETPDSSMNWRGASPEQLPPFPDQRRSSPDSLPPIPRGTARPLFAPLPELKLKQNEPRASSPSQDQEQDPSLPAPVIQPTQPAHPTQQYLTIARQTSTTLSPDQLSTSRKLLVLDLNGALLLRGSHRSRAALAHPELPTPALTPVPDADPYPTAYSKELVFLDIPKPRPVYPRAFFPSFMNYLFHEETRAWLDTMVWSSAQPHSVEDMVLKTFGGDGVAKLAGVWNRGMMGLTREAYSEYSSSNLSCVLFPLLEANMECVRRSEIRNSKRPQQTLESLLPTLHRP